jgi:hypothetical protein
MPRVGFEPTIPVFKQAKTANALDGAATMAGTGYMWRSLILIIRAKLTVVDWYVHETENILPWHVDVRVQFLFKTFVSGT